MKPTHTSLFAIKLLCILFLTSFKEAKSLDFRIDSLRARAQLNNTYEISFEESNGFITGNIVAPNHYDAFYLSSDTTLDVSDHLLYDYYLYSTIYSKSSGRFVAALPSVPDGNYFIIGIADSRDEIPESNETNNTTIAPILIFNNRVVDFAISVNTNLQPVYPAGIVRPGITIYNFGTDRTIATPMSIVLSTDTILGNDINLVVSGDYGSINGNSTNPRSPYFTIPAATAPGNYYLLYTMDQDNLIPELNENNNFAFQPITVLRLDVDLKILAMTLQKSRAIGGTPINITSIVRNSGTSPAAESVLHYYLSKKSVLDGSEIHLTGIWLPALQAGEQREAITSVFIPEVAGGSYKIIALIESTVQIETNENNNTIFKSFSVTKATRDFSVRNLRTNKSTYKNDDNVDISFVVSNNGNSLIGVNIASIFLSRDGKYSVDDIWLTSTEITPLAAQSQLAINLTFNLQDSNYNGKYYLIVYTDFYNYVDETNENNNLVNRQIQILPSISQFASPALTSESLDTNIFTGCKVFPNPIQHTLNLETTDISDGAEVVISMHSLSDGKEVLSFAGTIVDNKIAYTLPASMSKGHYFVHIKNTQCTKVLHVIKE